MTVKHTTLSLALLPPLLLLAACGTDEPGEPAAPTTTATVTVTAPAAESESTVTVTETVTETVTAEAATDTTTNTTTEDEPAEEPDQPSEGEVGFGETFVWKDGTSVTVSEPEPFSPGEWAAGGDGYDHHVRFTVTVENGTGEPLDVSLLNVTVQSGSSEADEVFDTDAGLEGAPMTTLLDGRTVEFDAGFGVEDPDDLVVQLAPTWDHESAYWIS